VQKNITRGCSYVGMHFAGQDCLPILSTST
jgi:hypothetical protein